MGGRRTSMQWKRMIMLSFLCTAGLLPIENSFAAIYKFVDKGGLIHFADDLQSIPAEYRETAKIVSGQAPEKNPSDQDGLAVHPDPVMPQAARSQELEAGDEHLMRASSLAEAGSLGKRVLISSVVVISAVSLFIVLGILDTDRKKLVSVLRVVLCWIVAVYLIFMHAKDATHIFSAMGNSIESLQKQSEEKGEKAASAVKVWNAMTEQTSSNEDETGK